MWRLWAEKSTIFKMSNKIVLKNIQFQITFCCKLYSVQYSHIWRLCSTSEGGKKSCFLAAAELTLNLYWHWGKNIPGIMAMAYFLMLKCSVLKCPSTFSILQGSLPRYFMAPTNFSTLMSEVPVVILNTFVLPTAYINCSLPASFPMRVNYRK